MLVKVFRLREVNCAADIIFTRYIDLFYGKGIMISCVIWHSLENEIEYSEVDIQGVAGHPLI